MNYFLDLVYNLVMSPRMALRTITRGEQWIRAGIIWLFTLFVLSSLLSAVPLPPASPAT